MRNTSAKIHLAAACRVGATGAAGALFLAALAVPRQALADVNAFTLRQPMNNATVRETVPIRVPRTLLNQAGYASVTIDGAFLGGAAVPDKGDVVYQWDTKHAAATGASAAGGNTGDLPESADGRHTVQVSLFDKDSNEIASATSTVRVLNRITTLPDGVRLAYKWRPDEILTYRLHSVLKSASDSDDTAPANAAGTASPPAIQDVYARLQRSVEDVGAAGILLRDRFTGGTFGASPLTQAFTLTSKYTTVNRTGSTLSETQVSSNGKHYGYSVDEFPDRRVNAGDSWQTPIMISLPWAAEKMTSVRGQARLDEFEWQNGYPTAKIVENYTGPATFHLDSPSQSSPLGSPAGMGFPGAPSQSPAGIGTSGTSSNLAASNVTVKRTVWFAYEAGVIVREETTITANLTGIADVLSSLTAPAAETSPGQPGVGAPGYQPPTGPLPGTPGYNGAPFSPGAPTNPGTPTDASQDNVESSKTLTLLSIV